MLPEALNLGFMLFMLLLLPGFEVIPTSLQLMVIYVITVAWL